MKSYISRCSTYTTSLRVRVCVRVYMGRSVLGFGTTNEMCELLVV